MLERNLDLRPRVVVYGVIQDHVKRNLSGCAPAYGPACLPCAWVDFDAAARPFLHPPDRDAYAFNRRFWDAFFFRRGSWPRRLGVTAGGRRAAAGRRDPVRDGRSGARARPPSSFLLGRMRALAAEAGAPRRRATSPTWSAAGPMPFRRRWPRPCAPSTARA